MRADWEAQEPGSTPVERCIDLTAAPTRREWDRLPEGWRSLQLRAVVVGIASGNWGESNPAEGLQECRVLRGTDFVGASVGDILGVPIRYIRTASIEKHETRANDLLVEISGGSRKQPTGRILRITKRLLDKADCPILHSNFVKRLRVQTDAADPEFFRLNWQLLYEHGRTRTYQKRTTGIWNLGLSEFLENEQVLLPPLAEQRAIASVLRTVQRAKEACERVIDATGQLKHSFLHYLFTYGPVSFDQADKVPLKETEVGPVPQHWPILSLGELASRIQYGTSTRCDANVTGYPVLRIPNVVGGRVDTTGLKYLAASPADAERYVLHSGDLLFVRTNGVRENVGRCAVYQGKPGRALFASYLIRVLLSANRALPAFVQSFTETSSGRASFKERASGAADGKFNINSQTIRTTPIPLPPLPVQLTIAAHLSTLDSKLTAEETRLAALDNLFKSLLQNLMTGKIRVNHLIDQLTGKEAS